ncbi:hypothetical protein PHLGIDRAFT_296788 [Phlebiopsis gigantea 11061_1 CR5-6]|uniref:GAR domain-containing protein n=1 Tax=Phlebiopsis gigantea (strain 11061_1 CR5-6) TaxID=745531 RepID=A0A0C3S361_PHLG1|nr:hypothetical protein PHLGIDRAFT_296788 [Phlebiopsis gigantea 11061_1 CR5-6]
MSTEPTPSLGNLLLNATTSDATLRQLLRVPTTTETQDGSHVTGDKVPRSPRTPGEEESLEWHEVIELQAFSERKAWIEEKIKFLEQLPPIQVFVGLDAVRSSELDVPGLPTREQLQEWMEEHDRIERQTEIFDSGELKKLKKFTKAATQRNLSPADTDLIELTLTTMYELDKLVHLLRDRSNKLVSLDIRLTWEERRRTSWTELRSLVPELLRFLETRARWSPSVYDRNEDEDIESPSTDRLTLPQPTLRRRGSTVSLASAASDASIPSLGISRGERFKLAELLSRDAAQFSSRASSLRHSKIAAAGKALDRLIDESRKPVPDELLDEQDKLEDQGINAMEDIGKFIMTVVMQWKKADEIYVETVKDSNAAQTLLEEIEIAKLHHPSSRQDSSFLSRSGALSKRLEMRGNPALASSHFPLPLHPLFPDQHHANDQIVHTLASQLDSARSYVRELEVAAKEYHAMFDAVKKVETVTQAANELIDRLESLGTRLESGINDSAGGGLPPDLETEACLQRSSHFAYVAHLPDLVAQLGTVESEADELLLAARRALASLRYPGIDMEFTESSRDVIDRLSTLRTSVGAIRDTALSKADILSRVRRIWMTMAEVFDRANAIRDDIRDAIEQGAWKSDHDIDAALLTPESPASVLLSPEVTPVEVSEKLDSLATTFNEDVVSPLAVLSPSLGSSLRHYLDECVRGLKATLDDARRMANLCASVKRQCSEMSAVRDETQRLQLLIEDFKARCESLVEDMLADRVGLQKLFTDSLAEYETEAKRLRAEAEVFQASLARRVPFVAPSGRVSAHVTTSYPVRHSISSGLRLDIIQQASSAGSPIDLIALDRSVRSDSNRFSMQLAGDVDGLTQTIEYLRLSVLGRDLDKETSGLSETLKTAQQATDELKHSVDDASSGQATLEELVELSARVSAATKNHEPIISTGGDLVRDRLRILISQTRGAHPTTFDLAARRQQPAQEVLLQVVAWQESLRALAKRVSELDALERARLSQQAAKEAEEEHLRKEAAERAELQRMAAERRAAEEVEARAQAEQERLGAEARERAEQERLEAEARERAEQERLEAETRERAEQERLEAEEKERAELERREAERRVAEEVAARTRTDEERIRQDAERMEQERLALDRTKLERRFTEQRALDIDDVFGMSGLPNEGSVLSRELVDLRSLISSLRKRLQTIDIGGFVERRTASLPTEDIATKLDEDFTAILDEVNALPPSIPQSTTINADLRSLRSEVQDATDLLRRVHQFASLATSVQQCDYALSDLLEHIDSYPAPPSGSLSSSFCTDTSFPPEDQLSSRLSFTKKLVEDVTLLAVPLSYDSRAVSEKDRVSQTWEELQAMGMDRVAGRKSRPPSAVSNGRISRNTPTPGPVAGPRRPSLAGRLSSSSTSSKPQFLAPPPPRARRSVSGNLSAGSHSRSSSRASNASTQRAVSGPVTIPLTNPNSRLYTSTYASRQRSNSSATNVSTPTQNHSTPKLPPIPQSVTPRPRAKTNQNMPIRVASPAMSETSRSRSSLNISRSSIGSTSRSTWSRAPRQPFPSVPNLSPPTSKPTKKDERKPYVPNPQNKLDVAVGDVVNNLPVSINIELVANTWKDQSGKYWIGDDEPKLCFCRILRSQTVMVRVGGGWAELSKFIKEHFADAFRVLPESPPRMGAREEKWISSATLQQSSIQEVLSPPLHPSTPEPHGSHIPSFALSTPTGTSPKSIKSSSPGSPLQPIQFIRRADRESPMLRTDTPTGTRPISVAHNPKHPHPAWRP